MRSAILKVTGLALAAGVCLLSSAAFGQTTNLNGFEEQAPPPPPGTGFYLGGFYTSPYYATINNGPIIPAICDDFTDENSAGDKWTANITSLSAFTGNTDVQSVYYGTTASITPVPPALADVQTTDYIAAAILATEILGYKTAALPNPQDTADLDNPVISDTPDLSYALWGLFDPSAITYVSTCPTNSSGASQNVSCSPGVNSAAAQVFLNNALAEAATFASGDAYLASESQLLGASVNVQIYSESAGDAVCSSDCTAASPTRYQEFLNVTVPEPATWAVLGFDFVGAGIVGLYFRRRCARVRP